MRSFLFVFFSICCFGACQNELEFNEVPQDLIPKDTFEVVLEEFMLIEGYTRKSHANVHEYFEIMRKSGNMILNKHHIDSARFGKSMDYYTREQELLLEIYQNILGRVDEKLNEIDTLLVDK